jgi:tetratricopeptide (TPR) repeat protein
MAIYGRTITSQVMRNAFPHVVLLAILFIPIAATGGCTAAGAGAGAPPSPAAGSPGNLDRSLPLFPNVSFTEQTLTAQDWYEQGFAHTNEGQYSEALLAYGKALSLNRSLLNAWYYSGDALFRLGRYGEALLAFENATTVDPDFVDAYFYESLVYEKLGRYQDRKDVLRMGLEAADRRAAAAAAQATPLPGGQGTPSGPVSPAIALLAVSLPLVLHAFVRRNRDL